MTFTVYSDGDQGTERTLPFDPIPRIVPADEWAVVEAGLQQRIRALNRFVHDVYHGHEILKEGIVPRSSSWAAIFAVRSSASTFPTTSTSMSRGAT